MQDNGISNIYTPQILDALKNQSVKATFHVTTQYIMNDALVGAIMQRIVSDGHTLGMMYTGPSPTSLSVTDLVNSVNAQAAILQSQVGITPKFIRLPYGQTTANINSALSAANYQQTTWNMGPNDYAVCLDVNGLKSMMASYYIKQLDLYKNAGNLKGSFIALHTDLCNEAVAISGVINIGVSYGYEFVTLDQCLGVGQYISGPSSGTTSGKTTSGTTRGSTGGKSGGSTGGTSSGSGGTINTNQKSGAGYNTAKYIYLALAIALFAL